MDLSGVVFEWSSYKKVFYPNNDFFFHCVKSGFLLFTEMAGFTSMLLFLLHPSIPSVKYILCFQSNFLYLCFLFFGQVIFGRLLFLIGF